MDKNFPKETIADATVLGKESKRGLGRVTNTAQSSNSNPALLSKWRPNDQTVDLGSGDTVREKFFIYLDSPIDEIWFWFQVERMLSSRRVIELACFLSVVIGDTFVITVTLNSAEMLRRGRRNSSDQVVLNCSIFCCFEEQHLPTAIYKNDVKHKTNKWTSYDSVISLHYHHHFTALGYHGRLPRKMKGQKQSRFFLWMVPRNCRFAFIWKIWGGLSPHI